MKRNAKTAPSSASNPALAQGSKSVSTAEPPARVRDAIKNSHGPDEFKSARKRLGLSVEEMAAFLLFWPQFAAIFAV
jgi:hypothetical protein